MAVTKTDVVNAALLKLAGQTDTGSLLYETAITAGVFSDWTTGTDDTMKVAAFVYPFALEECLMHGNWDFATKFGESGAELTGASLVEAGDWLYQFPPPSDALKVIRVVDEDNLSNDIDHQILANAAEDGLIILTNEYTNSDGDAAYLEYVFLNDDPDTYTAAFVDYLATVIAGKMASYVIDIKTGIEFDVVARRMKKDIAEQMDVEHEFEETPTTWFGARTA
jgi:hypothetical protein